VHASAALWHGRGVLLRGASGAGKSSLALRLLAAGAMLVADDLVALERRGPRVLARSPGGSGLIEARGLGIFRVAAAREAALALVVDLAPLDRLERLPEAGSETLLGVTIPCFRLDAGAADVPARVLLALVAARAA
jgi:serine kinase of HPr protein (carbohydrate metabolism regulator)